MDDDENMDYDYDYEDYNNDITETTNIEQRGTDEYELLKGSDFFQKREEQISECAEFFNIPKDEAEIVLINYNWNYERLQNLWFENIDKIKVQCGIEMSKEVEKKLKKYSNLKSCLVCEEEFDEQTPKIGLKCRHYFCESCYYDYLKNILDTDPLLIISTKCPQSGCNLVVSSSIFESVLSNDKESYKKYTTFKMKNYTESNSDMKCCPNPKCDVIARVPGHGMKEIKCNCGQVYCFKCLKESHRPCDCEMAEIWEKKNNDSDTNNLWLSTYTKQCPNCKKHIEKNQGCNHMTCRKEVGGCGYEFCWICLGDWKKHGTSYYKCTFKKEDDCQKDEEKLNKNKKYLQRFANYCEKYADHQKGQKYAENLFETIQKEKDVIVNKKHISLSELKFLDEALNTIIDCRRMLKYSYVFGYYLKEQKEILLYEHNQYLLDIQTDRLHEMMEKQEIPNIIKIENFEIFNKALLNFRNSIVNLISAIQTYKENLLSEIEGKMEKFIDYDLLYDKKKF